MIRAWNERLAVRITSAVGTMGCAYVFAGLAAVSLPGAIASHDPVVIIGWIAQTFLQLVLLPVIMVGQQGGERQRQQDHETLMSEFKLVREIHARVVRDV